MDIQEIKEFLTKFDIKEEIIEKYIKDKKIIKINNNLFLTKKNFKKNEVANDSLIYIQLKNLLPSKYLLNFIEKNTKNKAELKTQNQAMNFTYSKNLSFDAIKSEIRFDKGKYFLITFENKILGYVEKDKSDKKFPLQNLFDIGEYLKEI